MKYMEQFFSQLDLREEEFRDSREPILESVQALNPTRSIDSY